MTVATPRLMDTQLVATQEVVHQASPNRKRVFHRVVRNSETQVDPHDGEHKACRTSAAETPEVIMPSRTRETVPRGESVVVRCGRNGGTPSAPRSASPRLWSA